MAVMTLFFAAIARIPLGLAVAIEFLGPLTVAAIFGGRGWRLFLPRYCRCRRTLPLLGRYRLGGGYARELFAFGAAIGWGGYIVLMKRPATGDWRDLLFRCCLQQSSRCRSGCTRFNPVSPSTCC